MGDRSISIFSFLLQIKRYIDRRERGASEVTSGTSEDFIER